MVEFRILGPVEVVHGNSVISLGGPRHRRLLAVLLLHAGQVVSVAKLTDALWGDDRPRTAPSMLHVRVSELRATLRAVGAPVLNRGGGGYLLDIDPDDLDAARFERLASAGAVALADGDPERANGELLASLALWKGRALAEFAGEAFAQPDAARLEELRLQVVENRITADLELGRHSELVAELEKLVAEHPLRERFWAQHMLALYRAGRQGDALRAYQTARGHIIDQLGLDPGDALQGLHHAILTADPAVKVAGRTQDIDLDPPGGPVDKRVVPKQLPGDVAAFTGRADQLAWLDQILANDRDCREPALAVAVVSGTAGVGKTALAIHWAHQNRGRFPDGQLYVNLRGYDPEQPMSATHALARFLTALGVGGADIPLDLEEQAVRYRTKVAGRRMLIVLDNASSVEQVRPLLPGTATCAVLTTSRDSMAGLVAREGAHRLSLDLLPRHDAHTLLHRLIGRRADAEADAVAALADCCARLPLALRVAAELAVSRPTTPLSTLVDELADQQQRMDRLDAAGDQRAAVPTVFSWSIRHLPPDAARTFRLLGLHPGADLDAYAAAALADTSLTAAGRTLDRLARAHLLHPTGSGRYGMHDLLRAYATSLAQREDPETERKDALDRLFDYYLATAAAAIDRLHPTDARRRPRAITTPTTPVPELTGPDKAIAWLDAERRTMVAVGAHTARNGWPGHSVKMSTVLFRYLDAGHNFDALAIHQYAREAAEQTGDVAGQAEALNGLGIVHLRLGRYRVAARHLHQALRLFRQAGNLLGQARALGNVGIAEQLQGRHKAAAGYHERALRLYRQVGDRLGEARSLDDLGLQEQRLGRYQRAADHHMQGLTIFRDADDRHGQAIALNNLGEAEQQMGRYQQATHHLQQALALSRQIGDRTGEAWSLTYLGGLYTQERQASQATSYYREALAIFRQIGDRDGEPRALNGLGEAADAAKRPADAIAHHAAALAVAVDINAPDEQARAHAGLGHAHRTLGNPEHARQHYEHAVALYDRLGSPEADSVRAHRDHLANGVSGGPVSRFQRPGSGR
jgi:DNA-binding SARP family transcriptional activator/Tfp pilus assembly protein PilF